MAMATGIRISSSCCMSVFPYRIEVIANGPSDMTRINPIRVKTTTRTTAVFNPNSGGNSAMTAYAMPCAMNIVANVSPDKKS